jgi:hypothetical protein
MEEKAETLMYAADEFLQYYLADFDVKFKDAWKETVVACSNDHMPPWGHSDMESLSQQKEDKVVKWRIPVEMDGPSGEYFITFPDDLLEAANLNEGDEVEWVEQQEVGSFILRKTSKTYDEMISDGYTMTDDGFWIKDNAG